MRHTWRWFGPVDKVTIADARQAGAEGIVSALHHVPAGEVWTPEEIARRQREVATLPSEAPSGLAWEVVESLPVSEAIKTRTGDWRRHVEAWTTSLHHLAAAGIEVVCYNFMPVLDWTRTDVTWRVAHGGTTMRFDLVDFAVFDIHVLGRAGARDDYEPSVARAADDRNATMSDADRSRLSAAVNAGLPGEAEVGLDRLRGELARYAEIDAERLRANLIGFLEAVAPVAESLGLRLCCHPDDPPFPLMGLPRILSTEADYRAILDAVPSPANGVTLCTGSLGARPDNDLPGMARRLGPRIHFVHLRNVRRETAGVPCSFHEDEHLAGDTDMVAVIGALLDEEARRRAEGRRDAVLPMRPDHGQDILDDLARGAQPGYPAIGRLKGLAELRGVERALASVAGRR
ncbi:mannonate dehydratase [Chthonobacter rhizosphaerae]|uniref:mannonate dehydratase n=1 Tax=Chthonobacter rhizosphaerae TaxID=2735553 RepID=UPI0015EEA749|nr:mannonate dehydratase [Chthonobacter rhizosphaerae]